MSTDSVVETALVEHDTLTLLAAPLILHEIRQRKITAAEYLDLLTQGLARGLSPEGWLQELIAEGRLALVRHLSLHVPSITADELKRLSQEWRNRCAEAFDRGRRRIEAHQKILDHHVVSDLEGMLEEAWHLQDELWFDLSLEELAEIDRLLDLHLADAVKQREERFEKAQDMIRVVRRELIKFAEPIVRQSGTTEIIWELLGYADRLSTSLDCDLNEIEALCNAIQQIFQGAPIDETLLARYRSLLGRSGLPTQISAAIPSREQQASLTASGLGQADLKLAREPLSPAVSAFLDQLIGEEPSLLRFDLSQVTPPTNMTWNEETAKEYQKQATALIIELSGERDDASRAAKVLKLLQITLYLLRYWNEKRKSIPDDVRRELAENLFAYANWRAINLARAGRLDAACEYYRIAIRLRLPKLIGAKRAVLNYFAAYASVTASIDASLREITDLGSDRLILAGLRIGLESGDEHTWHQVIRGLVKLIAEDPRLPEIAQIALRDAIDNNLSEALAPAIKQIGQVLGVVELPPALDESITLLVDGYNRVQQRLNDLLQQVLNATGSARTLGALFDLVQDLKHPSYLWESTDQELLRKLAGSVETLSRYFTPDLPFQDRDRLAEMLLDRDLPSINQLIRASPTRFGILHLSRAIDNIQVLLEENLSTLRRMSLPMLAIRVEQSEWRSDDRYYCHLSIQNTGEIRADDVSIQVEESPIGEYQLVDDDQYVGTVLYNRPCSLHVRIKPTPIEANQDTFTLYLRLQYKIPGRSGSEVRLPRLRVDHFVAQRAAFTPIENPYVVGGIVEEPELFKGREELLNALLLEVANPKRTGSVVIFGQKRSGKSSLLYHLSRRVSDSVIPVLFDMPQVLAHLPKVDSMLTKSQRAVLEEELLGRMFLAMIKRTMRACQAHGLAATPMEWDDLIKKPGPSVQFREFLEQFRDRDDGHRLLFLLDEFTALMDKIDQATIDGTIMRLLKSLIEQRYFSCVICGLTEVYEAVKQYANQLAVSHPRQVDYLDGEAARGLIQDPIQLLDGRSRFYAPQVVDEIIDLTAGSPFYIQMFCHRLVEYMNAEEIERVTAADIAKVTESLITGSERIDPVQFDNLYRYKDSKWDDREAILEGLIVHLLAHETANRDYVPASGLFRHIQTFVTENELDETLGRLEQRRTIIQQADDPTKTRRGQQPLRARHYRIRVDLFRRWLLTNEPLDEEVLRSFERKLKR